MARDARDALVYGPFLRFGSFTPATNVWQGSVVLICKSFGEPLVITLSATGLAQEADGVILDNFREWQVWRFRIELHLVERERRVEYCVRRATGSPVTRKHAFYTPAVGQTWHWAVHSCSGFSLTVDERRWGGVAPLWNDVVRKHLEGPLHLVVGLGDQIYNDGVFHTTPALKGWFADGKQGHGIRKGEYTEDVHRQVEEYYFKHYCDHFSSQGYATALANIPQAMIWDDHDIFDGWGSYPVDLLCCPIFQGVFTVAQRFYLLFQHHTTLQEARDPSRSDLFGGGECFHFLKLLGPTVALLGVDTRSERTMKRVLTRESWELIFQRLSELPPSVRHLVVGVGVPMVYPKVPLAQLTLRLLAWLNRIGLFHRLLARTSILRFDEPEPLDDLWDQWTEASHRNERAWLVKRLQDFVEDKRLRVSFISGDVHACAVGCFFSHPKVRDLAIDPRFMTNVITSAIVNQPPPRSLIRLLHMFNVQKCVVDGRTKEKMIPMFRKDYRNTDKVLPHRNWCEVEEDKYHTDGKLRFTLWTEHPEKIGKRLNPYRVDVPVLKEGYLYLKPGDLESMMDERWFGMRWDERITGVGALA